MDKGFFSWLQSDLQQAGDIDTSGKTPARWHHGGGGEPCDPRCAGPPTRGRLRQANVLSHPLNQAEHAGLGRTEG